MSDGGVHGGHSQRRGHRRGYDDGGGDVVCACDERSLKCLKRWCLSRTCIRVCRRSELSGVVNGFGAVAVVGHLESRCSAVVEAFGRIVVLAAAMSEGITVEDDRMSGRVAVVTDNFEVCIGVAAEPVSEVVKPDGVVALDRANAKMVAR